MEADNPYFAEVAGAVTVGANRTDSSGRAIETFRQREDLVEEYAWAIPNEAAIDTIVEWSPILEVMAGSGYWARLITDAGGDVLAIDIDAPVGEEWYPVWRADARDVVTDYPERTLLMIWPPYGESVATETLGRYRSAGGDCCIYVGEGRGGRTADDRFHTMLHEEWTLEETVDIPTFFGIHDRLEVWTR